MPELNRWLQIVEMSDAVSALVTGQIDSHLRGNYQFKFKLTSSMVIDFIGCYIIEVVCKYLFADLEPKPLIKRGSERRAARRLEEAKLQIQKEVEDAKRALESKNQ
jgi:manganese-transporting P-type ATPase